MYRNNDEFQSDLDVAVKLSDEFTAATGRDISFEYHPHARLWEVYDRSVRIAADDDLSDVAAWAEKFYEEDVK